MTRKERFAKGTKLTSPNGIMEVVGLACRGTDTEPMDMVLRNEAGEEMTVPIITVERGIDAGYMAIVE